jgi:hypothetical protein
MPNRDRQLKERGFRLYQPVLRPDQIKALSMLKLKVRRPMTCLVREAVDRFLREKSLAAPAADAFGLSDLAKR